MKRQVDKKKFFKIIGRRPAMVRSLVNPSPDTVLACLKTNPDTVKYLDKALLTENIVHQWIKKLDSNNYPILNMDILEAIPEPIRHSLPEPIIVKVLENTQLYRTEVLVDLLKPSKFLFECLAKASVLGNLHLDKIPPELRTEEILSKWTAHSDNCSSLPDDLWTDGIVERVLDEKPECIVNLPVRFQTNTRLLKVLYHKDAGSMGTLINKQGREPRPIADSAWDATTAALAVELCADNIKAIPKRLLTRDICLKAVTENMIYLEDTPKEFRDRDMLLASLKGHGYIATTVTFPKDDEFLLAAARQGYESVNNLFVVRDLKQETKAGLLPKIIPICPKAIRLIEKSAQTKEMVDLFVKNAGPKDLENMSGWVNMQYITKDLVPLLISVDDSDLKKTIERKLKGHASRQEPQQEPVVDKDTLVMDLGTADYEEILKEQP